jgi:hypothetical protein
MFWDVWKKGFDAWEDATARYLEQVLKSPMLLGGSGLMLGAVLKLRAASEQAKERVWNEMGLPTRRDQERTLHLLNQIQSRLMDLEARLEDQREESERE